MIAFKCLRCGACCKNLIVESRFGTQKGLVIFPDERSLFSEKLVFPFQGVGKMPEDHCFKILTYQVDTKTCPHLRFKTHASCNIYEKRPLACRSFPFQFLGSPLEVLSLRLAVKGVCSFVRKSKVKTPSKIEAPNEKKAAEEMATKMSVRKGTQWYFDIGEKQWMPIGAL